MSARSKARKRALDVVFAAEARGRGPREFLAEQVEGGERPANDYTVVLVEGVADHLGRMISDPVQRDALVTAIEGLLPAATPEVADDTATTTFHPILTTSPQ